MKSSNTLVTIVVIAAVLIAAYGVGSLIHQARVGESRSQTAGDANDAQPGQVTAESAPAPGLGQTKDTPEMRAKVKERKAEILEKMESATEEQKMQFKEQVRERVGSRRTRRPALDPNTRQNSEMTGSEPNAAGQG